MRGRSRHRLIWAVGAGLALLGATVDAQAAEQRPAGAALPGAVVTDAVTPFDSEPAKTAQARCPAGTRVTGGGARISAGGGRVALVRAQPVHEEGAQDRFVVTAVEDEIGTTATWSLQAYAICANVPGLTIVRAAVTDAGRSYQSVISRCPAGQRTVTGGGGQVSGGGGQVSLAGFGNTVTGTQMGTLAAGLEDLSGFSGSWTLISYTVCGPENIGGLGGTQTLPIDSNSPKIVSVACDTGASVTGTGAQVSDVSVDGPQLYLEAVVPEVLVGGVPGNNVQVIARESIATGEVWNVRRHSHCSR